MGVRLWSGVTRLIRDPPPGTKRHVSSTWNTYRQPLTSQITNAGDKCQADPSGNLLLTWWNGRFTRLPTFSFQICVAAPSLNPPPTPVLLIPKTKSPKRSSPWGFCLVPQSPQASFIHAAPSSARGLNRSRPGHQVQQGLGVLEADHARLEPGAGLVMPRHHPARCTLEHVQRLRLIPSPAATPRHNLSLP